MFTTLLWLMANVQYILIYGADTALNTQLGIAMMGAIAAIIGSYVFGAVWDDSNTRQIEAEYPSAPPPADEGEP